MFSATVSDPILLTFAVYNFRRLDNKLLDIEATAYSEIIYGPINVGLSVKI